MNNTSMCILRLNCWLLQFSDVMVAAENAQNRGHSLKTCEIFALEERSQVLTNLGNSLPFSFSNFIVSFICVCLTLDSHFSTYCNTKNKTNPKQPDKSKLGFQASSLLILSWHGTSFFLEHLLVAFTKHFRPEASYVESSKQPHHVWSRQVKS